MKYHWSEELADYDGTQLRSLFAYLQFGVLGDSVVSWRGGCNIDFDHMVDGEDLLLKAEIRSKRMLHFIIEKFDCQLFTAVCLQRLFAAIAIDVLKEISPRKEITSELFREGDDVWFENKKLSISVATQSPTSSLIHFAVNCTNEGTPVDTLSLEDLGVEAKEFSSLLARQFIAEVESMEQARCKVKWVP